MEYFDIVNFQLVKGKDTMRDYWQIDFDEKNLLPAGYSATEYESKGFMKSKQIQDFPLRGKAVFLRIRKRRWRHRATKVIIKRDFSFISEGAKFTTELSDFLKDRS
jgi:hypothetical protein